MTLDEYKKYAAEYIDGARKISIRNSKPVIEQSTFYFNLEQSFGNYDLYFSPEGRLLYSVNFEKTEFKTTYGYNDGGLLVAAMMVKLSNGELMELSTFAYDSDGRVITESINVNDFDLDFENSEERIHSYKGNQEKILSSCSLEPEEGYTEIITYDKESGLIKDKTIRRDTLLILRIAYQYREDGSVVREIFSKEDEPPSEAIKYCPGEHGLIAESKHRSKESSSVIKYIYTFDEKGQWTNRMTLEEGEPKYSCDRVIVYY